MAKSASPRCTILHTLSGPCATCRVYVSPEAHLAPSNDHLFCPSCCPYCGPTLPLVVPEMAC